MKWGIAPGTSPYESRSTICDLCLKEKRFIATYGTKYSKMKNQEHLWMTAFKRFEGVWSA